MQRQKSQRIRYAVVGLGYISQIAALPAFKHAQENSELVGLVSDDPAKLKTLARRYGVSQTWSYDQYDACLASGIDAVYIGLPNSLHAEYTIRAAEAGIHVLTEKPMGISSMECQRMINACKQHRVKLMVAYRLHFEQTNLRARELALSGKIGKPRFFNSIFSMQVQDNNVRLVKNMGGGSIWDLGIYCINAARTLFNAEPERVQAVCTYGGKRFSEVDEMTSAVLEFPGQRTATFTCSFGASNTSAYEIVGTEGSIRLDPAYEETGAMNLQLTIGDKTTRHTYPARDQFAPEFLYFSRCILDKTAVEPSGYEGLADVRVIEALLKSAKIGKPITLQRSMHARTGFSSNQNIRRQPLERNPSLVHAQDPAKSRQG